MVVIGVCGLNGSGIDVFIQELVDNHGFIRVCIGEDSPSNIESSLIGHRQSCATTEQILTPVTRDKKEFSSYGLVQSTHPNTLQTLHPDKSEEGGIQSQSPTRVDSQIMGVYGKATSLSTYKTEQSLFSSFHPKAQSLNKIENILCSQAEFKSSFDDASLDNSDTISDVDYSDFNLLPKILTAGMEKVKINDLSSSHPKGLKGKTMNEQRLIYQCAEDAIEGLMSRWMENFVITPSSTSFLLDRNNPQDSATSRTESNHNSPNSKSDRVLNYTDYDLFMKRPFFALFFLQAPFSSRLARLQSMRLERRRDHGWDSCDHPALIDGNKDIGLESRFESSSFMEELIKNDDLRMFNREFQLGKLIGCARLTISLGDEIDRGIKALLQTKITLDNRWTRPSWDAYFMKIAELASQRSNCMKRRVGALVVSSDYRIVSTGYNGTAQGAPNCNSGGCPRCNGNARCGIGLENCLCLHAEENALLEAGRRRAIGCTLYSTMAPCIGCAKKIVQCGISRVLYIIEYTATHDSASVFAAVGIQFEKYQESPPYYLSYP